MYAIRSYYALPTQKIVTGTLGDIVEKANEKGVRPPAVIVIGEVVKLVAKQSLVSMVKNSI